MDPEDIRTAERLLGHRFSDRQLLARALTHASVADSRLQSNERLEFLGDAVLGMVVCDYLFQRYEDLLEGDLTKVKSMVVSRWVCAEISDELGLTELLILGNGIGSRGALPTSLRAAVLEGVIGALFIDGGYETVADFIRNSVSHHIDAWAAGEKRENFKSALQQHVQRHFATVPRYETLDEQGPDHSKCFEVCVMINNRRFPSAWGPSKKDSEQEAARRALALLRESGEIDTSLPI